MHFCATLTLQGVSGEHSKLRTALITTTAGREISENYQHV